MICGRFESRLLLHNLTNQAIHRFEVYKLATALSSERLFYGTLTAKGHRHHHAVKKNQTVGSLMTMVPSNG